MSEDQIIFVIHTNQYSGNFERQMCAYITGQLGECGVGKKEANLFAEELGEEMQEEFEEIIGTHADDNGCYRPAEIYPTPGRYNNGNGKHFDIKMSSPPKEKQWPAYESVAIYFDEVPTDDMITLMKERALDYAKSYPSVEMLITGFELIRETTVTTKTSLSI